MALANNDLGFSTEMMVLLDKVTDKKKIKDLGLDYEQLKKEMPYVSNAEYIDEQHIIKYAVAVPFDDMPLPDKVKIDGKTKYFDPVRKKGVPITPEEKVRQQVLRYLIDKCGVPVDCITSEDSLAHYDCGNLLRADITVRAAGQPLLIVECKENNIILDGDPLHQIMEYNKTIRSRYLLLTNGYCSYIFRCDDNGFPKPLLEIPSFEDMCKSTGAAAPMNNITSTRPDVSEFDSETIGYYIYDGRFLGENTPQKLAPVILNLTWLFLDTSYKLENIKGYGCKIVKDYGVVNTIVTNASSGSYEGEFRQLLVCDRFGNEQRICFSVFSVMAVSSTKGGYTSLICVIEINGLLISKLQVNLDSCLKNTHGSIYTMEHNGVRSRKTIKSMIDYTMAVCPELVRNGKIFLGELDNSKNITGSSDKVHDFLTRLVSYVILRKELAQIEADNR